MDSYLHSPPKLKFVDSPFVHTQQVSHLPPFFLLEDIKIVAVTVTHHSPRQSTGINTVPLFTPHTCSLMTPVHSTHLFTAHTCSLHTPVHSTYLLSPDYTRCPSPAIMLNAYNARFVSDLFVFGPDLCPILVCFICRILTTLFLELFPCQPD